MSELTENEATILSELKALLEDKEMLNRVITASYLISEIECQFGTDVAEFIVGYQGGLLQSNSGSMDGSFPVLSRVGDMLAGGFGMLFQEVNGMMCDISENTQVYVHSKEAKDLADAVTALSDSKKTPWTDNFNKAKADGFIK